MIMLILPVVALVISEITLRFNQALGFVLYAVLVGGVLIALSRKEKLDGYSKLLMVFTIIPVLRMVELFLPFEMLWNTLIAYDILLFLVTFYSLKLKIDPGYHNKHLILIPLIVVLGISLGFMGSRLIHMNGFAELIILLPLMAYAESVLFQGMIQNLSRGVFGGFASVMATGILYGIFSAGQGMYAALFLFAIGLVISIVYHYTRNIFLAIVFNMAAGALLYLS